jgi:hypothetical protein
MSHLKKYPTVEAVRALMGQERIDQLIQKLSDYEHLRQVAVLFGEVELSAEIISAWAQFVRAIQYQIPDLQVGRDWTLSRMLTRQELEEYVIMGERSDRYYHPENYPDYTADDITG